MNSLVWRLIALTFVVLGWGAAQPAQAHAADMANCSEIRKAGKANFTSRLIFRRKNLEFVEVRQITSIELPEQKGQLADSLTLSSNALKYKQALHCLLPRSNQAPKSIDEWHPEWRSINHQITQKHPATLQYESWNLIHPGGEYEVGPWTVTAPSANDWSITLNPSSGSTNASWQTISIDPGGLEISDSPGISSIDKDTRVWRGHKPPIFAKIAPPRDLTQSKRATFISSLGIASWWVSASIVLAASALPLARRDSGKSDDNTERTASSAVACAALEWAVLSAALGLALLLVIQPSSPSKNVGRALLGICAGLTMVLLARPWLPLTQGPDDPRGLVNRKRVVYGTSGAAAAVGLLVILSPHLVGLPPNLVPSTRPPTLGIAGLVLLDLSVLWLWLTAIAAWAWRFAREGRLGESPSETKPENPSPSNDGRPDYHLRHMVAVGAALAVVAAMVVLCRALIFEDRWKRANWMGEAAALFGTDHGSALSQQLADFASRGPQWAYAYTWALPGLALVALLHSNCRTKPETLGPEGVDLVAVISIFAIVVALRGVKFPGNVAAVYGLWLPLNMVALYGVVKLMGRWSVLSRVDRKAGTHCVVAELSDRERHKQLLVEARRCRELLHRLHLIDHGHAEETTRPSLEKQLRFLHRWRPTQCGHDCLPDPVSVVDVALSWGPSPRWWGNALNAARWASIFGILPSMVLAWYQNAYGVKHWTYTLTLPTGIPDTIGTFIAVEISFAGAGLVLGALWRVLPGERGPTRALSLFVAWFVPIVVAAVFAAFTQNLGTKELGEAVLRVILMLMVLTLTSMWMDTDTFSRERAYMTKRLRLLASIYELHGLSGQIAFLLIQAGAVVTIWRAVVNA
ncbi:DUF6185 family protein [Streptomyces sp. NPDC053069]|uniref:DUF6185 family protein n=1 Tax=Streptomyces sp. NPDC053069 TaxID=3365695 RepID=UPI0037D256CC